MKRKIHFFIASIILISILFSFNLNPVCAVSQTTNADISSINTTKYPGIKEKIENLKKEHPNWNFKIFYTGIDWNEAIAKEYTGHGSSPKNLVPDSSSYAGEWICEYCGNKVYDSGNWKCASEKAIKYMMDSRTSVNTSDIFQFLELSYNTETGYSKDVLKNMLSGSFLDNDTYINLIINSSRENNVNPYYITARIIQEQGKAGSVLVKGNGYKGQYEGYYNVFNIGAYGSNKEKVILNGLAKAKTNGWTSMDKAISGGIKIISNNYISRGQNTLYLQKFDVDNSDGSMYSHQYMQNIMAAQSEGETLKKMLTNMGSLDNGYTFIIPVYENMPQEVSIRPSTTNVTTANSGTELVRVNANPSIKMRNEPNGSTVVGYLYYNEVATRLEKASSKINGTYWDKILKSNGTIGYVARCTYDSEKNYKDYVISINNNQGNNINNTNTNDNINKEISSDDKKDDEVTNDTKKGDSNTDGKRDSADLLFLKKYLLNKIQLNETQKKNCDTNNDGLIDSADLLNVKKFLLGKINL